MRINGATGTGGGSVDPVTPPTDTSEAVASGGTPASKTFSSFTDPGGRIASYSASLLTVAGSGTLSGSGLGAYTLSGTADGDAYSIVLDALDSGGDVLATAVHTVRIASAGSGSWSTLEEVDFTTNITDLTLTKGGGDTTLFESDGTTAKATVGYLDRVPTTSSSAVITAAAGGFLLTSNSGSASTDGADIYVKFSESGTGVDWSSGTTYAVDILADTLAWGQDTDILFFGLGTSTDVGTADHFGIRADRNDPNYTQQGRRQLGSPTNGSVQNSDTSAPTDLSIRIIVYNGNVVDVFWTESSSYLSGYPAASGTVFNSYMGTESIGVEGTEHRFGADFYVACEVITRNATDSTLRIRKIRIQEFA